MARVSKFFVDMNHELKECSVCRRILPFNNFSKRKGVRCGRASCCYSCRRSKWFSESKVKLIFIDYISQLKECTRCGNVLDFSCFHKSSRSKNGFIAACKDCCRERNGYKRRNSYIDYQGKLKECSQCHKVLPFSSYYSSSSSKSGIASYCISCSKRINSTESSRKSRRDYARRNGLKIKEYRSLNRKELSKKKLEYRKKRLKTDVKFRLRYNLRVRFRKALQRGSKVGSAIKDLGCSIDFLKNHLESQFYSRSKTGEEMTWGNYGRKGWHIDHIKPLSSFNLEDRFELLQACHYTNLQPLWAEDNLAKGDR